MRQLLLLPLLTALTTAPVLAQSRTIDSLQAVLAKHPQPDTFRVDWLNELADLLHHDTKRGTNSADEYLRLAFQGQRAKHKDFRCTLVTEFDPAVGQVDVVATEIGRVLLNVLTNAFYAVTEQRKRGATDYTPTVWVSTHQKAGPSKSRMVEIRVADNGTGIAESVKTKIFQPFFTTKPTGEGTGLGLSLSYDIITKGHQGSLQVTSEQGQGTQFVIQLASMRKINGQS